MVHLEPLCSCFKIILHHTTSKKVVNPLPKEVVVGLTERFDAVVNCTSIHVKIKSKHTNLMKISRIEGYNGKYGSNS